MKSLLRRRFLITISVFMLFVLPIAVLQPFFTSSSNSSYVAVAKKKVKKKKVVKKKVVKKKVVEESSGGAGAGSGAAGGTGTYRFSDAGSNADTDGWLDWTKSNASDFSGMPGFSVFAPPENYVSFHKDYKDGSKQIIFGSGYSWVFNVPGGNGKTLDKDALNSGKSWVNLERIDIYETSDPDDTKYSAREFAEAFFGVLKSTIENAPAKPGQQKTTCQWTDPQYQAKTYGSREYVLLSYLQLCQAPGADGPVGKFPIFAFTKKANGNILAVYFLQSELEIRKPGTNDVNTAKVPNTQFMEQFLSKLKY